MKYSYTLIALAGAVVASYAETPEQCAQRCAAAFDACSTAQNPSPNFALCASQYKTCTGDHDASSSNQPTACQSGAPAPPAETPAPAGDETPEQCADRCKKQFDDCSTAQNPSPNFAFCASQYKTCTGDHDASSSNQPTACQSGAPAATPAPAGDETPEQCADRCKKQFDDCATAQNPSPNFAFCASQYKTCTGDHDASSSNQPTACQSGAPAPSAPTKVVVPAPAPTSSETPEQCADRCKKQFDDCSTAQNPSPNFAFCASQYKTCTGDHDASSSNQPKACSAGGDAAPTATAPTAAPAPTSSETPEECADRCAKQFDDCSTAQNPSPNFAFCASQYKSCTGNPDASSSNQPKSCSAGGDDSSPAPTASAPTSAAPAPAPTSSETPEQCADRCKKQFDDCSTAQNPSPNFAFCASQYKTCTGNSDASSSNQPTACGSSAPAAPVGGGSTTMATAIAAPTGGAPAPGSNSTIPVINGAGAAKPAMALLALGALALF